MCRSCVRGEADASRAVVAERSPASVPAAPRRRWPAPTEAPGSTGQAGAAALPLEASRASAHGSRSLASDQLGSYVSAVPGFAAVPVLESAFRIQDRWVRQTQQQPLGISNADGSQFLEFGTVACAPPALQLQTSNTANHTVTHQRERKGCQLQELSRCTKFAWSVACGRILLRWVDDLWPGIERPAWPGITLPWCRCDGSPLMRNDCGSDRSDSDRIVYRAPQ